MLSREEERAYTQLEEKIQASGAEVLNQLAPGQADAFFAGAAQKRDYNRMGLAFAVIEHPSEFLIAQAMGCLRHRVNRLVQDAIGALARWGRREALDDMVACMGRKDAMIRQAVVEALWDLKAAGKADVLLEALQDPSPLVRFWAAWAYADMFPGSAGGVLLERLARERDIYPRVALLGGLVKLGHAEYLPRLVRCLNSKISYVRTCTLSFLEESTGQLTQAAKERLMQSLSAVLPNEKNAQNRKKIAGLLKVLEAQA